MPRRPAPPPRDPSGINCVIETAVQQRTSSALPSLLDFSQQRKSSYDNVILTVPADFTPHKPPTTPCGRRSTPSPVRPKASPLVWSDSEEETTTVRRRPSSACGRAQRIHRSSVDWTHGAAPCCQPFYWCGAQHQLMQEGCEDLHIKICQLEIEKEQLSLQVNVLSDQVEAQNEKMVELENSLLENQEQLENSEKLLKMEMSSLSSAKKSKLELIAQISELKSNLSTVENDRKEIEERNRKLENELILTAACLADKEADLANLKSSYICNGKMSPEPSPEMVNLKNALSAVIAANDENERRIDDMSRTLNRYKKMHQLVLNNRSKSDVFKKEWNCCEDLPYSLDSGDEQNEMPEKPPPVPRLSISDDRPPSRHSMSSYSTGHYCYSSGNVSPQKTPPSKRHYSTLPRPHQADILKQYVPMDTSPKTGDNSQSVLNLHQRSKSGSAFGKLKLKLGKRCSSAPQLAPSDECSSLAVVTKEKGLQKILAKVKNSPNLHRGGIRATAGPRLMCSEILKLKDFKEPSPEWDSATICDWLICIGLGMYVPTCKKWIKSGEQLLKATIADFEKELQMKNPLHRKKLFLAVRGDELQNSIDHLWVLRWLDDIGLPQYKDAFHDARVDGRVLHHLTVEDLCHLKVTNLLHHVSIKTGIWVLRENNFDPYCLKRRPLPEDEDSSNGASRWTNHRVMEWLRTVDLSEYAPNLRGSGVHGGLMLYEDRFNADLLATLLNIPSNKTLLRRHLTTQFKQLIGPDIMMRKRGIDSQSNYTPLLPSTKVKVYKRSSFSLKRRNKNDLDLEDYVCPMNRNFGGFSFLVGSPQNCTEEEKFLMKEMAKTNKKILENMPASDV